MKMHFIKMWRSSLSGQVDCSAGDCGLPCEKLFMARCWTPAAHVTEIR